MRYRKIGEKISGLYLDEFPYSGTIIDRRGKYGTSMEYTVELDEITNVFGTDREVILITEG